MKSEIEYFIRIELIASGYTEKESDEILDKFFLCDEEEVRISPIECISEEENLFAFFTLNGKGKFHFVFDGKRYEIFSAIKLSKFLKENKTISLSYLSKNKSLKRM